jgi:hypothetical protein
MEEITNIILIATAAGIVLDGLAGVAPDRLIPYIGVLRRICKKVSSIANEPLVKKDDD